MQVWSQAKKKQDARSRIRSRQHSMKDILCNF